MLNQVLQAIESTNGALSLIELSYRLGIEHSALEGMIQYWVQKGRLIDDDARAEETGAVCATGSCGSSCAGPGNCAFVAKIPKTYSLPVRTRNDNLQKN